MKRILFALVVLMIAVSANADQPYVVRHFPLGIGTSVPESFWKEHNPILAQIAHDLLVHPELKAVVIGMSDAYEYRNDTDAKNGGLGLDRASAVKNLLVDGYSVPDSQITCFGEHRNHRDKKGTFRCATIRIVPREATLFDIESLRQVQEMQGDRITTLERRKPETFYIDNSTVETSYLERLSLEFGLRLAQVSDEYGLLPEAEASLLYKNVLALKIHGQPWLNSYSKSEMFKGQRYDVVDRTWGGEGTVFPLSWLGLSGGWFQVQHLMQDDEWLKKIRCIEAGITFRWQPAEVPFSMSARVTRFWGHERIMQERGRNDIDGTSFSISLNFVLGGE